MVSATSDDDDTELEKAKVVKFVSDRNGITCIISACQVIDAQAVSMRELSASKYTVDFIITRHPTNYNKHYIMDSYKIY